MANKANWKEERGRYERGKGRGPFCHCYMRCGQERGEGGSRGTLMRCEVENVWVGSGDAFSSSPCHFVL